MDKAEILTGGELGFEVRDKLNINAVLIDELAGSKQDAALGFSLISDAERDKLEGLINPDLTGLELKGTAKSLIDLLRGGNVADTVATLKVLADSKITQIQAQSIVNTAIAGLVDSSPDALNTLKELADALGDDPNFAATVTNLIGTKLNQTIYDAFIIAYNTYKSGVDAAILDIQKDLGLSPTFASFADLNTFSLTADLTKIYKVTVKSNESYQGSPLTTGVLFNNVYSENILV